MFRPFTVAHSSEECIPKWILIASKIFGLWPFSATIDTRTSFNLDVSKCLWVIIAQVIYAWIVYIQISTQYLLQEVNFSAMEIFIHCAMLTGNTAVLMSSAPTAIWNRDKLRRLIKIMQTVDREVCSLMSITRLRLY